MKLKTLLLTVLLSGFTHATVTPVWENNGVSRNMAQGLSSVGLNSKANWTRTRVFRDGYESSNRTTDIQQIFNDGFDHFTYIVSLRYLFIEDCYQDDEFTIECIREDAFDSKIESIKQQMLEVLSHNKDAVFVISLKPYKQVSNNSGIRQHQFLKSFENTQETRDALSEIWSEIALNMKDVPADNLAFNLLNEPEWESYTGQSPRDKWMEYATNIVDKIRDISPNRTIVIEGVYKAGFGRNFGKKAYNFGQRKYNGPSQLIIPINRSNIVYGFHYYEPYDWTHQDSSWANKGDKGRPIPSMYRLRSDLTELVNFSKEYQVPVILNEVGVNGTCNGNGPKLEDRAAYASTAYETLVKNGVGITWWALEDPNSPYKRPEEDCYVSNYQDLYPEEQLFKALRLTK
jgi:endoglucanase